MNFRSDLEDLHRAPKNVKAPLMPPLLPDSRGETEGARDHPQEISLVSWQQPTLKEIIVIFVIIIGM